MKQYKGYTVDVVQRPSPVSPKCGESTFYHARSSILLAKGFANSFGRSLALLRSISEDSSVSVGIDRLPDIYQFPKQLALSIQEIGERDLSEMGLGH
ncbi:hypothetical protein KIN20_009318 [Parelaphostrongylus tenuis]|uniref:Uncharacterized protein n=1 Tax=Parelaphostrongylus tenuis TaxID=148309 RepID=A0AAD5QNA2_PARTN|nr:hypothetical protein KIN20_009318 [Parelaphostrongylus tenuis]